ncbi:DgyrCDS10978 [Dimorphilus gyrociliatus]|uniref:DgyrCDS10978 n=1 Tax=Dimorphilus gyrociliatus TaxID=2664684 RepID=A0A7I8W320_9ANNE|nr:DgyrCDS10978 [Dimorphilus gyrociliatus]
MDPSEENFSQVDRGDMYQESGNSITSDLIEYGSDFAAGLAGGCAGLTFGHPFDTIKVRQQTMGDKCGTILNCLKRSLELEGPKGLFKGMAFPLVSVGFLNSIFFGVYGNALKFIDNGDKEPSYSSIFMSGAFAGAIQAVPASTIELVKVKLQGQIGRNEFKGPFDCLRRIYKNHGIRGCFRGLTPTILRDMPGFGVYIASYQAMCDFATPEGHHQPSVRAMLLSGGLGGVFSWIVNIPIDIVKSRLQADNLSNPKYKSSWDCVQQSYRNNGWRVFWRGLPVSCLRAFPVNSVTFVVYSQTLAYIQRTNGQRQTV